MQAYLITMAAIGAILFASVAGIDDTGKTLKAPNVLTQLIKGIQK